MAEIEYDLHPGIDWDKGKALLWFLQALDLNKTAVLPLYVGDDITGENAFRALRDSCGGIVGGVDSLRTMARTALKNPNEMQDFLPSLIALPRSKSP